MNETSKLYIAATEVERLLRGDETVVLIDVRTAEEFAAGHVPDAVSVPIANLEEYLRGRDTSIYKLLVTMFGSTGRGEKAAEFLAAQGMFNLVVMRGGLKAWRDARFPVVT